MRRLNRAWLEGRVDDLGPMVHPDIVTVTPGFGGRVQGRAGFLAGFREFHQSATIHDFAEHDSQIDVAGGTAVVSYRYDLLYERSGQRYRATGRDLWVFREHDGGWLAVWRTILDGQEDAA